MQSLRTVLIFYVISTFIQLGISFSCNFKFNQYYRKNILSERTPLFSSKDLIDNDPVYVYKDAGSLQDALCNDFIDVAKREISRKGSFYCAVPGGSVLKMLSGKKKSTYLLFAIVVI